MSGDVHVRFCENPEGRFLRVTRHVLGFQRRDDAERVLAVLPNRFARYGLTLHPEKTRLVAFGRPPGRGRSRPDTFDFLGFIHYWGRSRRGYC